jgi:hypothetical protein
MQEQLGHGAPVEAEHQTERSTVPPEAPAELAMDLLMNFLRGVELPNLNASEIQLLMTGHRAGYAESILAPIIDSLGRSLDEVPLPGALARYAVALMTGGGEVMRYLVEASVFARSVVEAIRAERSDLIWELELVRLVAELAARPDMCLTLARAGFPWCVSSVPFDFDDVSSFFAACAMQAVDADPGSEFRRELIPAAADALCVWGGGNARALWIAREILRIEPGAVFSAVECHPDFIETCCDPASPAILMMASRLIRAMVGAALGTPGAEAKLRVVNVAVPCEALLECLALPESESGLPALSVLASLAAAGMGAELVSACCEAVALVGPDDALNCDVKFGLSRLMVALLPSLNEAQRGMEITTHYVAMAAEIHPECEDDEELAEFAWMLAAARALTVNAIDGAV